MESAIANRARSSRFRFRSKHAVESSLAVFRSPLAFEQVSLFVIDFRFNVSSYVNESMILYNSVIKEKSLSISCF